MNIFKLSYKSTLALVVSLLALSTEAKRGGENSGGGHVIVCEVPVTDNTPDGKEYYLADTFDIFVGPNGVKKRDLTNSYNVGVWTIDEQDRFNILDGIINRALDLYDSALAQQIKSIRLEYTDFVPTLQQPRLPLLNNHHIKPDPRCKNMQIIQLAVQDIRRREVVVDKSLLEELSAVEQRLFYRHEKFINLRYAVYDTTPVRDEILRISNEFRLIFAQEFKSQDFVDLAAGCIVPNSRDRVEYRITNVSGQPLNWNFGLAGPLGTVCPLNTMREDSGRNTLCESVVDTLAPGQSRSIFLDTIVSAPDNDTYSSIFVVKSPSESEIPANVVQVEVLRINSAGEILQVYKRSSSPSKSKYNWFGVRHLLILFPNEDRVRCGSSL